MKLKSLMTITLIGTVLIGAALTGGSAASAANASADWTTTLNVKLALLDKLGTDSLRIDVDTNAGEVMLNGTVHKRETKELAEVIAETVDGVQSVDNDLHVESNQENPNKVGVVTGEAESEVKDALLETKIRLALGDKMGSDGFRIGTEAASGVVTLEFDPDFPDKRRQEATKIVKGVKGVTKVIALEKK